MARTDTPVTVAPGAYTSAGTLIVETAANTVDGNSFTLTGKEILKARNSGVTSRTVTVDSVPDRRAGREEDISEALAAGAERIYGPFALDGWQQSDRKLYFGANHIEVLFSVIRLP